MSAKRGLARPAVDVLRILESLAVEVDREQGGRPSPYTLRAISAVVSELIEAGKIYDSVVSRPDDMDSRQRLYYATLVGLEPDASDWAVMQAAQDRFLAALASAEGAT